MKFGNLLTILLSMALFVAPWQVQAQVPETELLEELDEYASPGVRGMGKPRGVVISYERLPGFDIESESDDPRLGNGEGHIKRHNKFSVRALAPVLNKPQTKIIVGVNYELEEFNFENLTPASYDLYRYLEDKNLKSIGLQAAYLHSLNQRNFYLIRIKGELNGDYTRDDINISDYFKATVDVAYGWKKTPDYAIGVGFQWGYTFGRQRVYPGILYNRTFNPQWGVESIFPANARLRYNLNEKTLFYAGYRLEGASYDIFADQTSLSQFNEIELRRTDIKGLLRVEREIYDFLWFAVEGGFRQYYRHRIYDEVGSADELITNDLAGAGYVGVELYLVPPRKFLEKD
ncbi:DUF6268 family outer membrane beta-barrel protein [Pontibacter anaerobius]|uniref:DUF6268 family outer membrane beta-barrel protein n=1 Tax=Pontibacter anaerobius TaxID=2993940 RepID=A0ABT3RI86_9BACT|nr:DUF6268 family outer membrane beta-barrel protein [Pontibacter anaerobius]MCX2741255.1 DUF6268 family outer membrane beta-barrel protein [Pontibacter anaerobius]